MKRIDVHAHYLPPAYETMLARRGLSRLDGGFPKPDWSEEKQLQIMDMLSIEKSYLSVSSPHLHMGDASEAVETARGCNEYGSDLARRYPGKINILASLPLPEIEASVREIRYCREMLAIDHFCVPTNAEGIYLGNPILEPVLEELNRQHTIVAIHPVAPAAVPADVCETLPLPFMEFFFDTTRTIANLILHGVIHRYQNVRFIVPHAGAYLPILSDRMASLPQVLPADTVAMIDSEAEGLSIMEDFRNLYYDLGGVVVPKQLDVLRKMVDDTHLLYGSDSPFTPPAVCVKLAESLDQAFGKELSQLVYLDNPGSLFAKE